MEGVDRESHYVLPAPMHSSVHRVFIIIEVFCKRSSILWLYLIPLITNHPVHLSDSEAHRKPANAALQLEYGRYHSTPAQVV